MRRLLFLAAIVGFAVWRNRTLDRYDKEHGLGAYAPVVPVTDP